MIRGIIFDLDGVLVDTARFHFTAWKKLAAEFGITLGPQHNEQLKGVSRAGSLRQILEWGNVTISDLEFENALARKNAHYLQLCEQLGPDDCLPGVIETLTECAEKDLKLAVGSASRNAKFILRKLRIISAFDEVIDGTMTEKGKPDPEVFLRAANSLGFEPWEMVVFEDAQKGIEAAINGGFFTVGVGDSEVLGLANKVIQGFEELHIDQIITSLEA